MKSFRNIVIFYTVFMLIALGAFLIYANSFHLNMTPGSYDNSEMEVYKEVWNDLNAGMDVYRSGINKCALIFWAVILFLGYALLFLVYYFDIKPVKDIKDYADEIARGNLDIPLDVNRRSIFVDFNESFDIMREELKGSKLREMEAENKKREMLAELSHDLKTPVATIQATCEVLELQKKKKREKLEQEGTADLKEIDGELEKIGYISQKTETINELVQNLLRANLDDMEEIEVNIIENSSVYIEDYFRSMKEYGNVILDNHIPECLVYIDKLRIKQVIDNIVGNSYKYAGTDIHVRFDEVQSASDNRNGVDKFIKITVRDSGPGVPESDLPLIIEKYYRGKDVKDKTGYGLGLYLVKWYMEKMGGGMEYYNDNGFVVELMVKKT